MHESRNSREAIEKYLKLEISATALRVALGTTCLFERNGSSFSLSGRTETGESLIVEMDHVLHAINLALRGAITVDALQEWANFILLCDECEVASNTSDARRGRLATVIHNLASPEIFGELTPQNLQDLKRDLAAFSAE